MEKPFDADAELRTLEKLAGQHAPSSREQTTIELAAKALLFIQATRQGSAFGTYLKELHADLTDEQRQFLARLGLG